MGLFLVLLIRLAGPILILRYPLVGLITAIVLDNTDLPVLQAFHSPYLQDYQQLDKMLDLYYQVLLVYVVFYWKRSFVRSLALGLFFLRITGVVILLLSNNQSVLLFFPNAFDSFVLFSLLDKKYLHNRLFPSKMRTVFIAAVLLAGAFLLEYVLHVYFPSRH